MTVAITEDVNNFAINPDGPQRYPNAGLTVTVSRCVSTAAF